jgi:DNA-directed RNA polymerase subunit K/omega
MAKKASKKSKKSPKESKKSSKEKTSKKKLDNSNSKDDITEYSDDKDISEYVQDTEINISLVESEDCDSILSDNDNDKKELIVKPENRITRNFLTKYEAVRIIGERTKQLIMGAKPLISNYHDFSNEQIAIEELKLNMIPFKIKRPVGDKYEIWYLKELRKEHLLSIIE